LSEAPADERVETFLTPRDWLRYAVGRFLSQGLAFGHGATTALDEAAFLILEGLSLPIDTLDPFLDARLLRHERMRLLELIEARATTRKPAAYLVNRAYIQGVPFYVDERVIVPRSLIGELVMTAFAEDNGLVGDPETIASVLDLCTGGG
jgi:ribosomal protein L3 glutamine methyltransferase